MRILSMSKLMRIKPQMRMAHTYYGKIAAAGTELLHRAY